MIIKRYIVNNMNEAMTRIRYELGAEAVIISQRKIRKPGIKGSFSPKMIEVTAAVENEINPQIPQSPQEQEVKESIEAIKKVVQQQSEIKCSPQEIQKQSVVVPVDLEIVQEKNIPSSKPNIFDFTMNIMSEIKQMKSMISELAGARKLTSNNSPGNIVKSEIEKILEDNDVDSEIIVNILNKIKSFETKATDGIKDSELHTNEVQTSEYEKLKLVLKEMIHVCKPKLEGRIVLVGPTGVGKTTTIAKLAGRLALVERKKVGLITVDTYRIGAVEQLKTYADIMNIPFKVVYSMKDMENAIESMNECEVILIDTTGRSSKNRMQISELRTFVEKVDTKNIQLVLSSTTKNKDIKYIIEGYQILNYNSIIVTKLDETSTYGSILNIMETAKCPLSFVTTGQNVPDDLKELSKEKLLSLILGEDTIC